MKFKALALAAVLAATGSAFAATVTRTTTIDHFGPNSTVVNRKVVVHQHHPVRHVVLVKKHRPVRHVVVVKPLHHRHYAFVRHDREHLASSYHPAVRHG